MFYALSFMFYELGPWESFALAQALSCNLIFKRSPLPAVCTALPGPAAQLSLQWLPRPGGRAGLKAPSAAAAFGPCLYFTELGLRETTTSEQQFHIFKPKPQTSLGRSYIFLHIQGPLTVPLNTWFACDLLVD